MLSERALNRAVLARQLLLERSDLPVPRALEQLAGLQTQYAPAAYVALWSRLAGFTKGALTGALLSRRVVQAWMMRCTIHMVSAEDHRPLTEAVRLPRRASFPVAEGVDPEAVADAIRGYLADGPLKQAELQKRLTADGFPTTAWRTAQLWIDLVRVPPAGTWNQPRAHVYGLADAWVRRHGPVSAEAGEELLVTRYLGGFGPASVKDVASFCGWKPAATRVVLDRMELRRSTDERGGELLDLPGAPLPAEDTPAPVRFLGQWDAVLLVHARRAQILPERHRPKVFATTMPQSVPTFLVDGQVAGTWKAPTSKGADGEVRVEPFEPLPPGVRDEVHDEARRLTAFWGS